MAALAFLIRDTCSSSSTTRGRDAGSSRRSAPRITTAEPWDQTETADGHCIVKKPPITLNIGFTYAGLEALGLPTRTLRMLPDEFIDGMGRRAAILGDVGTSAPDQWEPAWRGEDQTAHVWVSLNAGAERTGEALPELAQWTDWLIGLTAPGAVTLLAGHTANGAQQWQDSAAIMLEQPDGGKLPCPKEHFGFTDGISDPVFQGQFARGRGAGGDRRRQDRGGRLR